MKKILKGLKGMLTPKTKLSNARIALLDSPKPPKKYTRLDIKRIRKKGGHTLDFFAQVMNEDLKTVQAWETGKKAPSPAALRLLELLDKAIYRP